MSGGGTSCTGPSYFTWLSNLEAASGYTLLTRGATETLGMNQGLAGENASTPDQRLVSPDGRFAAVFQDDANFVLYQNGLGAIWASSWCGQVGFGSGFMAHMQDDGNFVIYPPVGGAVWGTSYPQTQPLCPSNQQTIFGPGILITMQDDGNLVMYKPGYGAVWASNTCCR